MRFGRDLYKHQIPEWAPSYVQYAELKKLSKFMARATTDDKSDATDLLHKLEATLRSGIAVVETFYSGQYAFLERRIAVLCDGYDKGSSSLFPASFGINGNGLSPQEAEEVRATCLELRLRFKKLQWYGKVNRDGFSNIVGKLKRLSIANVDDCMFDQCEFAGQCRSIKTLDLMDKAIAGLDADFSTPLREVPLVLGMIENSGSDFENLPFHRIVIRMGQNLSRSILSTSLEDPEVTSPDNATDSLALFTDLLDRLPPHQYRVLLHKDIFGCSPLHYASEYGLAEACHIILHRVQIDKAPNCITLDHAVLCSNFEGYTPLHLAVINGHTNAVRTLLECLHIEDVAIETAIDVGVCTTLAKLTGIALRSNFTEIAKLLLATGVYNIHYLAENGETALFIAARSGNEECVKMLIKSHGLHELDLNLPENSYGWTPLMVACVQGNQSIVEILLNARADQSLCDAFGWTARDHAAFRGFWPIVKLLTATIPETSARIPKTRLLETNALPSCRTDETRIFVNIGTLNTREPKPAVDINPYLTKLPYSPYPDISLSVKISAIGASGSTSLIHLPILNDTTNYPYLFTTTDLDKVKLVFSLFKSNLDTQDGEHIGGAVALLAELKSGLGPDRESFIRNYTIPILDIGSLEPIGVITFDFLVVKPFLNPNDRPIAPHEFWNRAARTQIIGHRGMCYNSSIILYLEY